MWCMPWHLINLDIWWLILRGSLKSLKKCTRVSSQITSRNAGLAKCLCQPPLVCNWAMQNLLGCLGGRQVLRQCLYSQSPQACKPVHKTLTWLTTALVECNALHTILAPVQAVCKGESGALNCAFWEVIWELTLASLKSLFYRLPTCCSDL